MDGKTVRKFREVLRSFERELNFQNNSSCCCGVTLAQCHTLMELAKKDNITLNELSEQLMLDKSTVSRTVDSLVKMNLINRIIPDENRRTTIISLTKEGIDVCNQINQGNDTYYVKAFSSIPSEDLDAFLRTFETMTLNMSKMNKDNNCII